MPRFLITSCQFWTGLAAFAAPMMAAEPTPIVPANPAAPVVQPAAPAGVVNSDIPPPPVVGSPSSPVLQSPPASYYSPVTPNVSAYYGSQGGYSQGYAGNATGAIYGTPGGYEARIGSPYHYYDPNGGQFVVTGDPYYDHWGPGFHRQSLYGHYRFPYYNYRAPWYYPGRAVYNRDTNFAW